MKTRALLAGCLGLPFALLAGDATNRYALISKRNPFALRTPAPAPNLPAALGPAVQIRLAGLAVIPPHKWALLEIQEPGKTPMPVTLQEGARQAAVEVREIDAQSKWVIVRHAGVLMTLTFEKNGLRARLAEDAGHAPLPTLASQEAGER